MVILENGSLDLDHNIKNVKRASNHWTNDKNELYTHALVAIEVLHMHMLQKMKKLDFSLFTCSHFQFLVLISRTTPLRCTWRRLACQILVASWRHRMREISERIRNVAWEALVDKRCMHNIAMFRHILVYNSVFGFSNDVCCLYRKTYFAIRQSWWLT